MVQEVRILSWCDKHNAEGQRVEGQPYRLSIGELKDREIDLCHACQEELLGTAYEWLQKVGRPVVEQVSPTKPRRKKKDEPAAPTAEQSPQQQGSDGFLWPVDAQLALAADAGGETKRKPGRPRTRPDDEVRSVAWKISREGGFTCPMCEQSPATDGALKQHLRNVHGQTVRQTFGTTCPVCAEEFPVLGAHTKVHDQSTLWFLFQEAVRLGDPHGVVAARQVELWNRPFLLAS